MNKKQNQEYLFELVVEIYQNICWAKFYKRKMWKEIDGIFNTALLERDLLDDYNKYIEQILTEGKE